MGWEKEYEHWRDYGHTWGPGIDDIDDHSEPTPEELKKIKEYEDLKKSLTVKPRDEVRIVAKNLEKLVPKIGELSLNWRETYSNEKLYQAKKIAQSLGYELKLQDWSARDENKFMVKIEYYGYIPDKGGNLYNFTVANINSIQDCLQLVADFSELGYWPTTWYKDNHITLCNTGELRLEMKNWGFPLEEHKKSSIDERILAASIRTVKTPSVDRAPLKEPESER